MASKQERLEALGRELLALVDPEPLREGLRDTPARWARWWCEFTDRQPGRMDTVFESVTTDQMVVVTGMKVWSLCEHHLLPFWCDVSVAYIPAQRVIGLSKLARIAHHHAARLQIQERFVEDVAAHVAAVTEAADVAVVARGEHLCMTMRGIRTPALMTSSSLRGRFRNEPQARAELMSLLPPLRT